MLGRLFRSSRVACLSDREGNVSVLDHMLDLSSHWFLLARVLVPTSRRARYSLVSPNSINQYTTNTGQKTGRLNTSNQLQRKPIATALVVEYQNLNSGRRRTKGRNSSSWVGRAPPAIPSSMPSSASSEGSNFGEMKARKRFRR
jgi:hypothetical protein